MTRARCPPAMSRSCAASSSGRREPGPAHPPLPPHPPLKRPTSPPEPHAHRWAQALHSFAFASQEMTMAPASKEPAAPVNPNGPPLTKVAPTQAEARASALEGAGPVQQVDLDS